MKKYTLMKIYLLMAFCFFGAAGYAQLSLNSYKYVIVPERFSFSKEDNQYYLNTAAKGLLDLKGFVAFVGTKGLPPAVAGNRCNALMAEVLANNSMFTTKLTLLLKDCQGNIIFKSKEGKSREKEYPIAYNEALNDAFSSLNELPYKYDSTLAAQPQQVPATNTGVPAAAVASVAVPAAASAAVPPPVPVPVPGVSAGAASSTVAASAGADISGTLYAQPTENGYQLIDTTPKKVLVLLKTSLQDCFIADGGPSPGMVFKKGQDWVLEYYKDNKLVSQKLAIKF
jgi:hypothetical protein